MFKSVQLFPTCALWNLEKIEWILKFEWEKWVYVNEMDCEFSALL